MPSKTDKSPAKTPTWSELRKTLSELEKPELIDLLQQLYKLNADNKVFLMTRLYEPGEVDFDALAEPYRKVIRQEFNPARGFPDMKLSVARKALNDFKKTTNTPMAVVDLLLFYVEQGVVCTNNYGDIDEAFYNSHISAYAEAAKRVREANDPELTEHFRPRAQKIVRATSGIGWGFHDELSEIYYNEYPSE